MRVKKVVQMVVVPAMPEPEKGVFNTILHNLQIDPPLASTNNPDTATYWLILVFS